MSPAGAEGRKAPAARSCAARLRSLASRFGASIAIVAFGVLLVGLLWGVVAFKIRAERAAEISTVTKETGNLARVFEEHVLRTIREADRVLQFIIDQYAASGTAVDLRRRMEDGPIVSRIYTYLSILDARGDLVAGSQPVGAVNFADREHFRAHVARDTGQLFISKPVLARATGKWTIQLSRRISNPDGSFGGVAVVSIDPQYFAQLYSQTDLGSQAMITLVGRDGAVRARRSRNDVNATVDTSRWTLFKVLPLSRHGSYASTGAVDGLTRVFSYRALANYPLVVLVGAAEADALADFNDRRRGYIGAAALATLIILGFTAFLLALVWRQENMAKMLRRHNAELAHALQANNRLAAIVEDSNDAIISRGLDGTVTSWNAGAERLFGYSTVEATGRQISDLILPPEIHARVAQNVENIRRGNIVAPYETRRRTKDGRIIDVLSSVSPVRDETGAITAASVIMRDISERRKAEAARAELAAIVEQSNDAIITRSADGYFQSWNKGAEQMFGYTAAEAIGQPISLILPPELRAEAAKKIERTRRGEAPAPYEAQRVTKDGRIIDVLLSVSPIKDGAGRVTSVSIIFHDVSARKKADATRAQLAAIVESTTDAVISRGLDGAIQSWNAAAARMFGWSAAEALGQPISIIVPAERRGELRPFLERVVAGEAIEAVESVHCRKDGARFPTSVSCSAIKNAEGAVAGVSLIYRDISDRKRLERAERAGARQSRLLEALARTSNEAAGPEDAMRRCLQHILEDGKWSLGCVGVFPDGGRGGVPQTTYWHAADRTRYETFIAQSERTDHTATRGHFVGKALREKQPVWIPDIARIGAVGRIGHAARAGLRSAFAFPVLVRGEVAAFLEFFSEEAREPEPMMLETIGSVGAQLARLVERERADRAMRTSEARLRAILDNEPECVKVIAADGSLLEMNRGGLAMLEANTIEQVRAHGVLNFVLPQYRGAFADALKSVARDETVTFEFEVEGLKGTRRWMESRAAPIILPGGGRGALFVTRDLTEKKRAVEKADYLAHYDTITGLPNRTLFRDRLEVAVARARRRDEFLGLLRLNLDRFKKVNESLGHEAGDALLKKVAARLTAALREVDTLARLGGNDYAVLVEGMQAASDVNAVAEKLTQALAAPFEVQGHEVFVSASIGVAICSNGTCQSGTLIETAEKAMSRVKQDGGGGHQLARDEPVTLTGRRLTLETSLRYALDRGELEVHYQPKVNLLTGAITGAEALMRWKSPQLGWVSPAQFIPIAEETGLIVPMGAWILESACRQAANWREQGHDLRIAVNLSPRQFRQKDLATMVRATLARCRFDAANLELEITESTAMTHAEQTIAILGNLHRMGVRLSVDDFGTGYSSLSYLRRFPLHCLKIDRSFVRDAATDANSVAIVRATIALAHSLRLNVVAEGIETDAQRALLLHAACDEGQGFLFSKPLPAEALTALLESRRQPQAGRSNVLV